MYFPVANLEISPLIPFGAAMVISLFTSTAGISGAFLLLPLQVSLLGFTTPAVSATNHLFNVVAIPGGIYRFIKEGRMVWPLVLVVIVGTLPGVFIGGFIRITYLPDPKQFQIFVGAVLLYIGIKLLKETIKKNQPSNKDKKTERKQKTYTSPITKSTFSIRRIGYQCNNQWYYAKTIGILTLSLAVGLAGGIYGIGGGAIIAPFFVSFYKLPIHTIAGATLTGTFVTSITGVFFFQYIAPSLTTIPVTPDWKLGLLFGAGGLVGIYTGARIQKFLPARLIQIMLTVIILFIAVKYLLP